MAEGYVNLAPVIAAIHSEAATTRAEVQRQTAVINAKLREAMDEIDRLKAQLNMMEKNAKMRASLQKAISEIIRVRQELDEKFGTHKEIRENMIGILQATDSGLITKETIAKVSEELMLSAPRYWLAPCLIAIAAWIGDNRDLANKAIAEAVRRDNEKTSLLMALIMRRVNAQRIKYGKEPTNSTFVWLGRYFSYQNPLSMKANIVSYVDAYTNGIFGEDVDNLCYDSITSWLQTLAENNPNFKDTQIKYWTALFSSFVPSYNTDDFKALKYLSPEYNAIYHFVTKISAITNENGVSNYISKITHAEVNAQELINAIDDNLITLVKNYDEEEVDLRDEEQYLSYIKEHEGDEEIAKSLMSKIKALRNQPNVDFASRLSLAITDKNSSPSVRKTAVKLLNPYISEAFANFIDLSTNTYPESITLKFTEPGLAPYIKPFNKEFVYNEEANINDFIMDIEKTYDSERDAAVAKIVDDEALKYKKKAKICFCLFFLLIPLIPGAYFNKKGNELLKSNSSKRSNIKAHCNKNKAFHTTQVKYAVVAKKTSDKIVNGFMEKSINSKEIFN